MHAMTRIAVLVLGIALGSGLEAADAKDRQAEVAERGRAVMPFDLDATMHRFEKRDDGGVQRVVAKSASDAGEVRAIREHLGSIAVDFRKRDFGDPRSIHGAAMPGLAELAAADEDALSVEYSEIDGGAAIAYRSVDPAIVRALHRWFDAQVSDHGHHAAHHAERAD